MTSPVDSATLVLKLFERRREPCCTLLRDQFRRLAGPTQQSTS